MFAFFFLVRVKVGLYIINITMYIYHLTIPSKGSQQCIKMLTLIALIVQFEVVYSFTFTTSNTKLRRSSLGLILERKEIIKRQLYHFPLHQQVNRNFLCMGNGNNLNEIIDDNSDVDDNNGDDDDDDDDVTKTSIISYDDFADFDVTSSISQQLASSSSSSSSIWYDDFQNQSPIGEGNDIDTTISNRNRNIPNNENVLLTRIASIQQQNQRRIAVCDRNWKLGNWFVRGFSLEQMNNQSMDDNTNTNDTSTTDTTIPIPSISVIATSNPTNIDHGEDDITVPVLSSKDSIDIWVGRTDGSIFGIHLGTDYWTRLSNQNDNDIDSTTTNNDITNTIYTGNTNILDWDNDNDDVEEEDDEMGQPQMNVEENPFTIVTQFQIEQSNSAVSAIVAIPTVSYDNDDGDGDDDNDLLFFDIYTASIGSTNIQHWFYNGRNVTLKNILTERPSSNSNTEGTTIQKLQKITGNMIVSVDLYSVSIWDTLTDQIIGYIDTIQRVDVPLLDYATSEKITCADSDSIMIYIGTESGYVFVYSIDDILHSKSNEISSAICTPPIGVWRAAPTEDCSITAIKCGGYGTLGRNSNSTTSTILFTGDAQGTVKQWEVLKIVLSNNDESTTTTKRKQYKVEAWPKLSTQRLPKKAHVFVGHYDAITSLLAVDALKFVSASADGTVRAWNTASGKELFRMDGFPDPIRNLCLLDSGGPDDITDRLRNTILVTDGMDKYVCIHDFSADDEEDADYDLDMPEYRN